MEKKSRNSLIRSMLLLTLALILFTGHVTFGQVKLTPPKMRLMPDTVLRQIAVDILRMEKIIVQQDSTIKDLRSAIVEKDSAKVATDTMLTEAQFREEVLQGVNLREKRKTDLWMGRARKYKRQRNFTFAGAAIVVVAATVKIVKDSLKD